METKKNPVVHYYDAVLGATACGSPALGENSFTVFEEQSTCGRCREIRDGKRRNKTEADSAKAFQVRPGK